MLNSGIAEWLFLSLPSSFYSKITLSVKSLMTILYKIALRFLTILYFSHLEVFLSIALITL